jgi:hypothetical protein
MITNPMRGGVVHSPELLQTLKLAEVCAELTSSHFEDMLLIIPEPIEEQHPHPLTYLASEKGCSR